MHKYFYFVFFLVLFSCNSKKEDLRIVKVTEHSSSKLTDTTLIRFLNQELNVNATISTTLSEDEAINELKSGDAELIIIPNNQEFSDNSFRMLFPLLPRVLIISTNLPDTINGLKSLLENHPVYFEDQSRLDSLIFDQLYYHYAIDKNKIDERPFQKINPSQKDSLVVYIGLTHIGNPFLKTIVNEGWSFIPLDDYKKLGNGSKVEGFLMSNTYISPFIIPENAFQGKPEKPILTFSIRDILISKKELPSNLAYEITSKIITHKAFLKKNNSLYNLLDFEKEKITWAFPFHEGALRYYERDKPSEWLKWVNIAWPVLSIIVIIAGGFTSIKSHSQKKRKKQFDQYNHHLLGIREKVNTTENIEEIDHLFIEMDELKIKVINMLAKHKFDSGESFNLFLALFKEIRTDLMELKEELIRQKK